MSIPSTWMCSHKHILYLAIGSFQGKSDASPFDIILLKVVDNYVYAYLNINLMFHCRQYRDYLEHVLEYLITFFQRTEPLQNLDRIFSKVLFLMSSNLCFSHSFIAVFFLVFVCFLRQSLLHKFQLTLAG